MRAAFTSATSDLRAVPLLCSTTPSWVGILWFDTSGALVGAIDLRTLITTAS